MERVFNHDGFGVLAELARTGRTEDDAAWVLVEPLADSDLTAIDWCICSTGIDNCRTRHGRAITRELLELLEDLPAKGVDGISLDFERKAPFFPDGTPQAERFDACTAFVRQARTLTDKPILARVACRPEKGQPHGRRSSTRRSKRTTRPR